VTALPERRGRGRPPKLGPAQRQTVLDAVAVGATLTAAAAKAGVTRATVHNTRARDPAFDRAVTAAQEQHQAAEQPCCPGCAQPELALTAAGVECRACHTRYLLVPAQPVTAPGTVHTLAPPQPLAHTG